MTAARNVRMHRVFIATSLDGYIASRNHGLDWLDELPNPGDEDYGFSEFMDGTDAILMGRVTFDVVSHFRPWPYDKPVLVATSSLREVPEDLTGSVQLVAGSPTELSATARAAGHRSLYVDGGRLITSFLAADLIDTMIISRLPVVLGDGIPLFGHLPHPSWWQHESTRSYATGIVQSTYSRKEG